MAKYSDIKGFTVQTLSTDPASSLIATGTWATAANIPAGKMGQAGGGSMTAAIVFGGNDTFTDDNSTYEYDGAAWTAGGNMSEGIGYGGGGGSQTSAIAMGGYDSGGSVNTSEEYDGSSWTAGGNMNIEKYNMGASVIGQANTDASVIGGRDGPSNTPSAKQENYNGTAWTEIGDLPAASYEGQATGTTTAAIYFAGTGYTKTGASWNGSSWTTNSATLNTDRSGGALSGSSTDALMYSGYSPGIDTEYYNGTTWTKVAELGSAAPSKQGRTTQTTDASTALCYGGYGPPTGSTRTEEWTLAATPTTFKPIVEGQLYFNSTTNTFKETITDIPGTAWASGGSLNTARSQAAGFGVQTSMGAVAGRSQSSPEVMTTAFEQYDGTSWTETTDCNTARRNGNGFGPSSALGTFVGGVSPGASERKTESWNGSSWTEVNDLNRTDGTQSMAHFGTYNAGIVAGGEPGDTYRNSVEQWDGTNWTEIAEINTPRSGAGGLGIVTDGFVISGYNNPSFRTFVESWNGTSWTETTDINTARGVFGSNGTTSQGLIYGGQPGPKMANTEFWNGSSWTELNDLSTARDTGAYPVDAPSGATSAVYAGGDNGSSLQSISEEWTSGLSNKTITTS